VLFRHSHFICNERVKERDRDREREREQGVEAIKCRDVEIFHFSRVHDSENINLYFKVLIMRESLMLWMEMGNHVNLIMKSVS
jgi:hypothetical protein